MKNRSKLRVVAGTDFDARACAAMNEQQHVSTQIGTATLDGRNDRGPRRIGNTTALTPLLDSPLAFPDVLRHIGKRVPAVEDLVKSFDSHGSLIPRDSLSRQVRTTRPVTKSYKARTMRPMSRTTTPTTFKKEFCQRLKAARTMAGFEQAEFAKALGILPNTYGKYEKRSLLPHYLIPQACALLQITADQLYPALKEKRRNVA